MSKKPKPATAGEKVVLSWLGGLTTLSELRDQHNPTLSETRGLARRIDAAIRRAVKKERERWVGLLLAHMNGKIGVHEVLGRVREWSNP